MRQQQRRGSNDSLIQDPFVERLQVFTPLDADDLATVRGLTQALKQVRARAEFISPAARRPDHLHVLVDGWACRFRLLADGRRQITAVLLPGDICDLSGLHTRIAGYAVGSFTQCTVALISAQGLRNAATASADLAGTIGWLAAVEAALLTERVASLGRRSAAEHLSHLLCELMIRNAVVGLAQGLAFPLRMTQEEIADVLGLTSVHVNRVLQILRGDGLIEQRGGVLAIRDWDGLKQMAGFRPDYLHLDGVDGAATERRPDLRAWTTPRVSALASV